VEFPQVVVYDADDHEDAAAQELANQMSALGVESPFVVVSSHGKRLASYLSGPEATPNLGANQQWAAELGSRAHRSGADALVAIGGGRCLDVAKLAAARAGLGVIAVPTQLSHDGICSPVAVVPNPEGRAESVGAIAPRAVFLSLPTLIEAPDASARAGIGDLLANPLALRDWALAIERGIDDPNERAWHLSVESFELIEPYLDGDPNHWTRDPAFHKRLGDALILSGLAMICAGTSRPASGAEHEISHALDEAYGGRAMHGAQVAFGCIVSVALYGGDADAFRRRLSNLRLPQHPHDLGLSADEMAGLLLAAPNTRPGRYTVLEAADLDEASARSLVTHIWPDA
jgi:glycerol-1-phosphate dehydrogenase [NAD(P)+]